MTAEAIAASIDKLANGDLGTTLKVLQVVEDVLAKESLGSTEHRQGQLHSVRETRDLVELALEIANEEEVAT